MSTNATDGIWSQSKCFSVIGGYPYGMMAGLYLQMLMKCVLPLPHCEWGSSFGCNG